MSESMLVSDDGKCPLIRAAVVNESVWLMASPEAIPTGWILQMVWEAPLYDFSIYRNAENEVAFRIFIKEPACQ